MLLSYDSYGERQKFKYIQITFMSNMEQICNGLEYHTYIVLSSKIPKYFCIKLYQCELS